MGKGFADILINLRSSYRRKWGGKKTQIFIVSHA